MKTHIVLIDFENVQVKSLALLKGDQYRVKVFIGPKNTKLPVDLVLAMQKLGESADYIMLQVSGANALDFHITYYLGKLVAKNPEACFHIISKDKGFDSLIQHVQGKHINCTRSTSIEEMTGANKLPAPKPAKAKSPAPKATQPKAAQPKMAQSKPVKKPAQSKSKPAVATPAANAAVEAVVADLIKRKTARPGNVTRLVNTIRNKLKTSSDAEIQVVFNELVKRGQVKVDGEKVSYSLPAAG